MEAKDTVIPVSKCPYQPDGESDELYVDLGKLYQEKFMQGARKQAPISFKAGQDSRLREVEEWMDKNCLGCRSNTPCNTDEYLGFHKESWQAFLKGLEGDK